ncbi:MAG: hypothetical protein WCR33_00195 [Bacilli bacterium]
MKKIKKINIKHRVGGKIDYKSDTYIVKMKRIFFYISLVTSALFAPLIYIWLNSIEKIYNVLLLPLYLTILYFVVAFVLLYLIFYIILQLFQKNDVVFAKSYYIYKCDKDDIINRLDCRYTYKNYNYNVFVTKDKGKQVYLIATAIDAMPSIDNMLDELDKQFGIKDGGFDQKHTEVSLFLYIARNDISLKKMESLMEGKDVNTIYAIYNSDEKKLYIQRYMGKDLDMVYATKYEEMLDYIYDKLIKEDNK